MGWEGGGRCGWFVCLKKKNTSKKNGWVFVLKIKCLQMVMVYKKDSIVDEINLNGPKDDGK